MHQTPRPPSPFKLLGLELEILFTGLNHALRFLLELVMLGAFAYWGWKTHAGAGSFTRIAFAIGAPLIAALVWGLVLSPKAPARLSPIGRLLLSLPVFLLASLAMRGVGKRGFAIPFAVVATLNTVILVIAELRTPTARISAELKGDRAM